MTPSPRYRQRYLTLPRTVTASPSEAQYGQSIAPHSHDWAQLLYASEGVMRARTEQGVWIIPPRRALLIAPGIVHELTALTRVTLRALYIAPAALPGLGLGEGCRLLEVSALLRELILALCAEPVEYAVPGRGAHLAELILSELAAMETVPIAVPWPRDRRLQTICSAIIDDPGSRLALKDHAQGAGASERTLIRLFPRETGLPYRQWVQQVHLAHAFQRLAQGDSVGQVARSLGYASPSAFTQMFRRLLGKTPQHYQTEWRARLP